MRMEYASDGECDRLLACCDSMDMQVSSRDPRIVDVLYATIFLGWTVIPFPDSAMYDFSVWTLATPIPGDYSSFMVPVPTNKFYVS
jgi:hypothetical protein